MKVRANHPFVVWGSCFLWLSSMFAITWSIILFLCVGDMLLMTSTDILNAIVLLAGIIMLPTNVYILFSIANGRKINHTSKVICCPLWLCIAWIILINVVGVGLCAHKLYNCKEKTYEQITETIKQYRSVPQYKHFIDNLQWALECCGLHSYSDWFNYDWYDRIRDYEWDPGENKRFGHVRKEVKAVADSVPLSCCKSGSCISNYLLELGTHSIHTKGCGITIHRIIMYSMIAHLIFFLSIIIVEMGVLTCIIKRKDQQHCPEVSKSNMNVRHLMTANNNFDESSASLRLNSDEDSEHEGLHDGSQNKYLLKKEYH